MKTKLFLASLFATALFTGCSSDEPAAGSDGSSNGEPQFLTVNLVTTGTSSSRAQYPGSDPESKATYEDGLEAENKVTSVRFYFFDGDDKAVAVKHDGTGWVNYSDWTPGLTEQPESPNVEKVFSATLVLQTPENDKPDDVSKMVAIINPTAEIKALGGCDLEKLEAEVADYATKTAEGEFVMSNSTYMENGAKAMAVSVAGHVKTDMASAIAAPVDVYVERTVAKVRLNCSLTKVEGTELFDPSDAASTDPVKKNQVFGETKIYVKFLGWNVTAAADKSRLIKEINTSWDGSMLGSTFGPWNWAEFHRSFWAWNAESLDYLYGDFNNDTNKAYKNTAFDGTQWAYLNENASDEKATTIAKQCTTPSQVIIAAQLVDKDGNAVEFAEYGSKRYSVDALKTLFADGSKLYKKTVTTKEDNSTEVKYELITPADLKIVTATSIGKADKENAGRYKVYVQLAEATDGVWYPTNNESQTEKDALTAAAANEILVNLGSAKVWSEGYTYYYFDINHVEAVKGADGTETQAAIPGVVRNHIYDATITSLVGLGTPVYDPDEVIYPEHPDSDNDKYLAARIKILTWRVVKNDISLEW